MDAEKLLSGIVRVGTVTDVNNAGKQVRVKFRGENLTSGWLYVVNTCPSVSGSGVSVSRWMPSINDSVLCIYIPVFNGDGFVIGGI